MLARRAVAQSGKTGARSSALPPDLLSRAQHRLAIFAVLVLLNAIAGFVLGPPVWRELGYQNLGLIRIVQVVLMGASAGMAVLARFGPVHPRVLDAGLVFQVALCYFGTLGYEDLELAGGRSVVTFGPAHVMMLAYPLIVPMPPRRALAGAIAAAAMVPLSLATLAALGRAPLPPASYVGPTMVALYCAAFAIAGSRVVHRLSKEVVAAREIGSYRLETLLGKGGMGEVWRANHRLLARPAAIKLIRQDVVASDPAAQTQVLARFEREAQVTASLRCPHTIALYDFGVADDGAFYYVMELLDGLDAQALVERFGPLPAERAVYLMRQICESLAEAHDAHLVHRDIKPSNIFVCRYGRDVDFVKVLDFGLVKPRASAATTGSLESVAHVVRGTPAFMAPEQIMGDRELDARADVYAAGCVAFWLLTGQSVFTGATTMETLLKHVRDEPPAPSQRSELPIPPALDSLVLRCLAKDPAGRPASADQLAQALARVPFTRPWTREDAADWWARHAGAAESKRGDDIAEAGTTA
jgi:serine/threonine-protein kinase